MFRRHSSGSLGSRSEVTASRSDLPGSRSDLVTVPPRLGSLPPSDDDVLPSSGPLAGLHRIVRGMVGHYRIGTLSLTLVTAAKLSNDDWTDYLEGTLRIAAGEQPTVAFIRFTGAFPDAAQRQFAVTWGAQRKLVPMRRVALATDSELLRGALTAYNWIARDTTSRAFSASDPEGALRWMGEVAKFDHRLASVAWRKLHQDFAVPFGAEDDAPPSGGPSAWRRR